MESLGSFENTARGQKRPGRETFSPIQIRRQKKCTIHTRLPDEMNGIRPSRYSLCLLCFLPLVPLLWPLLHHETESERQLIFAVCCGLADSSRAFCHGGTIRPVS